MSMRRSIPILATALAVLPALAHAQRRPVTLGWSATTLTTSHEKLGDPMSGWTGRLDVPVGRGRYAVRATAEQTSGTADARWGRVCGCFEPHAEPDEPLRDDARLLTMSLGVARRVVTLPHTRLDILANLQHALATGTTTGQNTGGVLAMERRLWGAEIGLEGAVTPWSRLPIALEVGTSIGALRPLAIEQVLDAPSAYNAVIGIARFRVGVSLRMP